MYAWFLRNVRLKADFFAQEKENWYPTKRAGAHQNAQKKIDGFMAGMNAYILRMEDRIIPGDSYRDSRPIIFDL
jgi:phage terminase large subunit-like protein